MDAVEKFVRCLTSDGSVSRARRLLSDALRSVRRRVEGKDPEEVLRIAVQNASPLIELKRRRIGGALYRVPLALPRARRLRLGIEGILSRARRRGAGPMWRRLAVAIVEGYRGEIPRPDVPQGPASPDRPRRA
jgi:small subunit ribosomal protein S7